MTIYNFITKPMYIKLQKYLCCIKQHLNLSCVLFLSLFLEALQFVHTGLFEAEIKIKNMLLACMQSLSIIAHGKTSFGTCYRTYWHTTN